MVTNYCSKYKCTYLVQIGELNVGIQLISEPFFHVSVLLLGLKMKISSNDYKSFKCYELLTIVLQNENNIITFLTKTSEAKTHILLSVC